MNDYSITDYGIFSNGVSTTKNYNTKIDEVGQEIETCKTTLSDSGVLMGPFQEECLNEINKLNTDFSSVKTTFSSLANLLIETSGNYQSGDTKAANTILNETSANSTTAISTGAMTSYQYDGKKFNVVNTKTSIDDYANYIQSNKMYQNAGFMDGQCMLLSQYYAKDLLTGKNTSKSTMADHGGAPAVRINERVQSETNEDPVLEYAYQELSEGHPVVLQVTQRHSDQGLRHLVTAVGYDSSVTSSSDLTPDKILVLDCVDGQIQTLDKRNRKLYNQGGKYQALGPTEKFLAAEVNDTSVTA